MPLAVALDRQCLQPWSVQELSIAWSDVLTLASQSPRQWHPALAGFTKTFPKTSGVIATATKGIGNAVAKSPIGRLANAAMVAGEQGLGKIREFFCTKGSAKEVLGRLPGKSGKTGPVKLVPDAKALDNLFNALTRRGKPIHSGNYPGKVVELPDRTVVRMRPGSKSGGATIDVTLPDGRNIKVHIQ